MNEVSHSHSSIPTEVYDFSEIFGMTDNHRTMVSS